MPALLLVLAGLLLAVPALQAGDAAAQDAPAAPETNYYAIDTPQGRMVVRLYDETPLHRDNFRKLAAEGFFDGTTFHRIIEGFMIQGGDPNTKDDDPSNDGEGGPGYMIPAEFVPSRYHKRGALAAARTGDHQNPERKSSGSQFYIVQGTTFTDFQLGMVQNQVRAALRDQAFTFSEEARQAYKTVGGAPNLDGQYTVFGELVEGFEVLDAVAATPTPRKTGAHASPAHTDRPLQLVPMFVRPLPDYEPAP